MKIKPSISGNSWIYVDNFLLNALDEDIGNGDVTTSALISPKHVSDTALISKGEFIIAGLTYAERIFHLVDKGLKFKALKKEGDRVRNGSIIARIKGNTASLLLAERTALNLLQRISGIATITNQYVVAVKGLGTKIADTRKTAPGLRYFDKYAVRTGGGSNHRYGLFDGILIKDNHISAVGSIGKAVKLVRSNNHHLLKIEVETRNLSDVRGALNAGADVIMLDNMTLEKIKKSVDLIKSRKNSVIIEVSGNMNLGNVRKIAETGVDMISVGAITHSAAAADISMMFD